MTVLEVKQQSGIRSFNSLIACVNLLNILDSTEVIDYDLLDGRINFFWSNSILKNNRAKILFESDKVVLCIGSSIILESESWPEMFVNRFAPYYLCL